MNLLISNKLSGRYQLDFLVIRVVYNLYNILFSFNYKNK